MIDGFLVCLPLLFYLTRTSLCSFGASRFSRMSSPPSQPVPAPGTLGAGGLGLGVGVRAAQPLQPLRLFNECSTPQCTIGVDRGTTLTAGKVPLTS